MAISPLARRALAQATAERNAAETVAVRQLVDRVRTAVDPALSNGELALALELPVVAVGRFVSEKGRSLASLPDRPIRAALEALASGALLLAVGPPGTDRRRAVLVCAAAEAGRLGAGWRIYNAAGGPVPGRASVDWEDDDLWDDPLGTQPVPTFDPSRAPRAPRAIGGDADPLWVAPIGLGAMRLSTLGRPSTEQAIATLHAAWGAGVTLVDSANVYGLDETDLHHNERLIAEALRTWPERDAVVVATKGGLRRKGTRWLPDGHPDRLTAACQASAKALGVERIDLYQLHAVDGRVPLEDSLGALARLHEAGVIRHVGLCNVSLEQLEQAMAVLPIASVQNRANPFDGKAWSTGLVDRCAELGVAFIAHSPLGGWRAAGRVPREPAFERVGRRHGLSPREAALTWLVSAGPHVIAIPGATRPESAVSSARALRARIEDADRRAIAERCPFVPAPAEDAGEAVVIMGPPAAGKTSQVQPYVDRGYVRLNRDTRGGTLAKLVDVFEAELGRGNRRFVLDNTYPTRESRAGLLRTAQRHGVPVRCVLLETTAAQCRFNAARRMIATHGDLLDAPAIAQASKRDPNTFPPVVIDRWFARFEAPTAAEGFAEVVAVPYVRSLGRAYTNKAVILDYDGTLRTTRGKVPFPRTPADVVILPRRRAVLQRWVDAGYRLLGLSNQAGVALGQISEDAARACVAHTNALLGLEIDAEIAIAAPGQPSEYGRKPMPGYAVWFIEKYQLDPDQCVMVGDREPDRLFAEGAGLRFFWAEDFFEGGAGPDLLNTPDQGIPPANKKPITAP